MRGDESQCRWGSGVKRERVGGVWACLLVFGVVLVCATRAGAAGAQGEGHATSLLDLVFPAVNFLLFIYLVRRAGGENVRTYLRQRRAQVISALDAAAAAKAEAGQAHAELRGRLEHIGEETGRLSADIRAAAEMERDRRLRATADAVGRIISNGRLVAEQEVRTAIAALRDETVGAAVAETVALLRRQIVDVDEQRFLAEFVEGVGTDR